MKKLSLSLIALGLVSTTFAALPATTDPTLVSVPQLPGGFFIGGTAFYLEPSVNNGAQDFATFNTATSLFSHSSLKAFDLNHDLGWGINLGYIFPQTGNDVAINYWHVSTDNTDSVFGPGFTSAIFPITFTENHPLLSIFTLFNQVFSKSEFDFDQVDLSAGQFIDIGCRLIVHPTVGIQYTKIDHEIHSNVDGILTGLDDNFGPIALPVLNVIDTKSDFDGIGPRFGIDGSYYLGAGFGLVGHFATALLIGNVDSRLSFLSAEGGFFDTVGNVIIPPFGTQNSFSTDSNHRIVPNLQGKLGVDYTFMFNNAANSYATLEVGYQVDEYFNALDHLRSSANINIGPNDGDIAFTPGPVTHHTSDFALNGVYANLTFYL